jgi:hypothetical protein
MGGELMMDESTPAMLTAALQRLGIPILGVSFGRVTDRATWRIDYRSDATQAQKDQAEAFKLTYDATTDQAWVDGQADATVEGAKAAIAVGAAVFKAITGAFPTPAQRLQIKADAKTVWKLL